MATLKSTDLRNETCSGAGGWMVMVVIPEWEQAVKMEKDLRSIDL